MVETRNFGKLAIENTIDIINYFKPNFWYIENPSSGYIWAYIKQLNKIKGIENKTYYNNYGFPAKKPTTFFSNIKLNLKLENVPSSTNVDRMARKNRSDIPENLLIDILKTFLNNKKN